MVPHLYGPFVLQNPRIILILLTEFYSEITAINYIVIRNCIRKLSHSIVRLTMFTKTAHHTSMTFAIYQVLITGWESIISSLQENWPSTNFVTSSLTRSLSLRLSLRDSRIVVEHNVEVRARSGQNVLSEQQVSEITLPWTYLCRLGIRSRPGRKKGRRVTIFYRERNRKAYFIWSNRQ